MVKMPDRAITEEEVQGSLRKMKASKAAEPHGLHQALLKTPAEVLVKPGGLVHRWTRGGFLQAG